MHQNELDGRASPGPAGGAYSSPPDPIAGLKGRKRREDEGGEERGRRRLKCVDAPGQTLPTIIHIGLQLPL